METNIMRENNHTSTEVSTVFHPSRFVPPDRLRWPRDYWATAHVRSVNLDEIFRLTQHVDGLDGPDKALVQWIRATRSTSVGDVVVVKTSGDRKAYRCDSSGWTRIE
jgi:hypothetical protein